MSEVSLQTAEAGDAADVFTGHAPTIILNHLLAEGDMSITRLGDEIQLAEMAARRVPVPSLLGTVLMGRKQGWIQDVYDASGNRLLRAAEPPAAGTVRRLSTDQLPRQLSS